MNNNLGAKIRSIAKSFCAFAGTIFSVLSVVLSFTTWEELGVEETSQKILTFFILLVSSFIMAAIYVLWIKRKEVFHQCGTRKMSVLYGDIVKIGFPMIKREKRIVVIPVNTAFDTIVDDDLSSVDYPLVSACSIHGQWVKRMQKENRPIEEEIQNQLIRCQNMKTVVQSKSRGNCQCYQKGMIVPLQGYRDNITFWLIAIAEFDEENKAHSSPEEIMECLDRLIEYVDGHSQGYDVYLPLMGTGFSRAELSPDDALLMTKAKLLLNIRKIHGSINVVIHEKERLHIPLSS